MPPRKEPLELDWSYLLKRIWFFKYPEEKDDDFLQRAGMTDDDKSKWGKDPVPNVGFQKLTRIANNLRVPVDEKSRGWFFSGDSPPPLPIVQGRRAAGGD